MFGDIEWPIVVLYVATGLLVIIACDNIANLLMVRGLARSPEMAIRSALGAERLRLCRQMLTESLVLSLLGGALGLSVSWWGVDLMRGLVTVFQKSGGIAETAHIALSPWVLVFTMALSFGTTLVFGLLPSWQASQTDPADALRVSGRGVSEGVGHRRLSRLLVVGEITLSFVLLIGFCLLFRSLDRLSNIPLGYNPSRLLNLVHKMRTKRGFEDHARDQIKLELLTVNIKEIYCSEYSGDCRLKRVGLPALAAKPRRIDGKWTRKKNSHLCLADSDGRIE